MKKKLQVEMYASGGLGNQILQLYALLFLARIQDKLPLLDVTDASKSHSTFDVRSFKLPCATRTSNSRSLLKKVFPKFEIARGFLLLRKKSHLIDMGYHENRTRALEHNISSASGHFVSFAYINKFKQEELKIDSASLTFNKLFEEFAERKILGVHVRRGDFTGQSDTHGCLSASWYLSAIKQEVSFQEYDKLIIFTNDGDWVRKSILQKLTISPEIQLIDQRDIIDPAESWELMKHSNCLITANSSFSLTAAVFCGGRVIVPFPLSKGLNYREMEETIPAHWIRLSSIWE